MVIEQWAGVTNERRPPQRTGRLREPKLGPVITITYVRYRAEFLERGM